MIEQIRQWGGSNEEPPQQNDVPYRLAVIFQQALLNAGVSLLIAALCFIAYVRTPVWSLLVMGAAFFATAVLDWWCWHQVQAKGYRLGLVRLALGSGLWLTCIAMWLTTDSLVQPAAMTLFLAVFVSSAVETPQRKIGWIAASGTVYLSSMVFRRFLPAPSLQLGFVEPLLFYGYPVVIMSLCGLFGQLTMDHLLNAITQNETRLQELHHAYADIEKQVRDRTRELESANQQLRLYAAQAQELAATETRNQIARDIHDGLGHYLTVINVNVGAAREEIARAEPISALESLAIAQTLTREGLAEVRRSVATLRPAILEHRPLVEAVETHVAQARATGINTTFHVLGEARPLAPYLAAEVLRTVQEGLTNVYKHAHATKTDLTLDYRNAERIRVVVTDDGVGTDHQSVQTGFMGIRERAAALGGTVEIRTVPGHGLSLELEVPG